MSNNRMPSLPSLPKIKTSVRCACGCTGLTQSRFVPGHDAKLLGRVRRVKAGVFDKENPTDLTAQLDASLTWLTVGEVEATAEEMGIKWTEATYLKRLAKAEEKTA